MTAGDVALVLGCLALVVWSSWRWAAVARLPGVLDVLVACGVLTFGTIVATVLLVAGVLHALSAGPVVLAAVGTAALAAGTTATRPRRARIAETRRALRAALRTLWRGLRSPLVLLLALAAGVAVGYRLLIAVAFPALDWDALAYHLPMVDYWLQERRLLTNPFSYWAQIYPGAAESGIAWLGALTGSVRAAAAVQIGAAALGALTVVALCRRAGCTARSSLVGGLLFLLAPMVLTQLSTAEVDIAAAATLLACWHLLLIALRTRAPEEAARWTAVLPTLVIAGVGAGVAVGVKVTNLLSVAVLGGVLVATALLRAVRDGAFAAAAGRAVVQLACFGLPAVALGAYWYVRNALLWGNPFYPLAVAGLPGNAEVVGFAGVDPRQVGTTNRYWALLVSWASDLEWRTYFYGSFTGGLGAQWLLVLVPAVVVAFVLLARSRYRLYAWAFLAPGILLLLLYPGSYHTRYTLFLLGLGGVALGVVLDRLPRLPAQGLLAVVTAAAVFSAAAASWRALDVSGGDTGATPRGVLAMLRGPAGERGLVGLRGAFAATTGAEPGSTFVVPPEFGDFGEPWVLPHALWGDDLQRRVVKSDEPIEDADQALRALRGHGARYVVVAKNTPLEAALDAEPGRLHPVFDVGWLARAWTAGPGVRPSAE